MPSKYKPNVHVIVQIEIGTIISVVLSVDFDSINPAPFSC